MSDGQKYTSSGKASSSEVSGKPRDLMLPATVSGLRAALSEGLRAGIESAAHGEGAERVRARFDLLVDRFAARMGPFWREGSPYRDISLSVLKSAVDAGRAAHMALHMVEAGEEEPPADAPESFLGATNPPDPAWLAELTDEMVGQFTVSCELEGLEIPLDDSVNLRNVAKKRFGVITDEGVHKEASQFMYDGEGKAYQLIVVRSGTDVDVYRRYIHEETAMPVIGGYRLNEVAFIMESLKNILGEIGGGALDL